MSQSLEPISRAATVADFSAAWIANVRAALQRDGQATRAVLLHHPIAAGGPGYTYRADPVIEVQSINTGEWQPLNLPTNTMHFATETDRDAVLDLLVGRQKK